MKKKGLSLIIAVFMTISLFPMLTSSADLFTANPTASAVLVNDEEVSFDAYNINDNNYFKLRDLAYVLNGTECQFEVVWDGELNAINLISGEPYTEVGGEMTSKGTARKTATETTSKIYLDGDEISPTAYNIEGNNYFKLRDIGKAFDFRVGWDGDKNTITIDTSKGYYPEADKLESAVFIHTTDENKSFVITGVRIIFDGRHEEIIPEDFTEILLSRNGKVIDCKLIYEWYQQVTTGDGIKTYFNFKFEKEIDLFGIYQLSGSYKGEAFITAEFDIPEPPKPDGEDVTFSVLTYDSKNGVNLALTGVWIQFNGTYDYINPDDFTDIKLTKDKSVVNVKLIYSGGFNSLYNNGTEFYFRFEKTITEPGIYSFSGKYRGVSFENRIYAIIESYPLSDNPANPDDIRDVIFHGTVNNNNEYIKLTNFMFFFYEIQQAFSISDLTDLKLTLNGNEIEFSLQDNVPRQVEYDKWVNYDSPYTLFYVHFVDELIEPGIYQMTGKYRGKPFASVKQKVVAP